MSVIVPAILADNPTAFKEQIERVTGFAERIHIDLSDGEFAPTFTVGIADLWAPEGWVVDIHLMAHDINSFLPQLISLTPNMIIVHSEASSGSLDAIQAIKKAGIRAGLALLRPTVPKTVEEMINQADHVMIFSGELGRFGGTASLMQLEKIRLIKAINPNVEIGWDGGVTAENAYSLVQGGVDVLNVGGVIHKASDPRAAFERLRQEISKTGVLG